MIRNAKVRKAAGEDPYDSDGPEGSSVALSRKLMTDFAAETGLDPVRSRPRRYLWTDAFAVCNFLELFSQTHETAFLDLSWRLVEQVHDILGRHREEGPYSGWLSRLDEAGARMHPTVGGLRIGKPTAERSPGEPFDARLEWDRDGQYYHYLTKWMHALNRLSRVTRNPAGNRWAIELAKTAHARFTHRPAFGGRKQLYWKMSIDLSRPQVSAAGSHDPLDGLVTCRQLQATAVHDFPRSNHPDLGEEVAELNGMVQGKIDTTNDPLGIGGLLFDAVRMAQLMVRGETGQAGLLAAVLDAALRGMEDFLRNDPRQLSADYRLAFRELGLAIGLKGLEKQRDLIGRNPPVFDPLLVREIEALLRYARIGETIIEFWARAENRETDPWSEHREINGVMLATSLMPEGFLTI